MRDEKALQADGGFLQTDSVNPSIDLCAPKLSGAQCLLIGLWMVLRGSVSGAEDVPWQVDSWNIEKGLPNNSVTAIAQTRGGFLWIGTGNGFSPRLTPEEFKAAFTCAEGWGTYGQHRSVARQSHSIEIKHGRLQLVTVTVDVPANSKVATLNARLGSKKVGAGFVQKGTKVEVTFSEKLTITRGARLEFELALIG